VQTPEHVGIIMDGNGRWAQARGLDRTKGHLEGLKAARRVTQAASDAGVKYLSLYVFSTENWKRSVDEVGFLMGLVTVHLEKEFAFYRQLGLRVVHSGDREELPTEVRRSVDRVMAATAHHTGMTINLVLNHGGRDEIVRAVNRWTQRHSGEAFTAHDLRSHLDVPDLRLSNFLLWQAAYAEFVFSEKLWPDFTEADLDAALAEFAGRGRRFGAVLLQDERSAVEGPNGPTVGGH
jgi:undecaprenyl diphosphate synthase